MDEKVEIINDKEELFKKLKELKQSKAQQDKNPTVFSPFKWRLRPDKVVSTVIIGGPGVEVMPNNLKTFLNPRIWLMKLMLAIHFFLYRHVTMGNTRSVIGGRIMMIPLYKRLVDFATDKKKRTDIENQSRKMVNDRILHNIGEFRLQVQQIPDEKRKKLLMDAIDDAYKKNSNN